MSSSRDRAWRIVTPEAVALDLEAAGLASRMLAALLDVMCLWFAFWVLLTVVGMVGNVLYSTAGDGGAIVPVLFFVGTFLLLLAWPVAWEVATKGRSIGKMALGIRVVTVEGAPIRFRHALIRGLVGLVELLLFWGVPALLIALGSRRFRRLGDHLAGTVVVRSRSALAPARAIRFMPPPGWEELTARLDTTALSPEHHRLVRAYLLRVGSLDAATRASVGAEVFARVTEAMGMAPHVRDALAVYDPVIPLTAIAASYQRRFSPDPVAPPTHGWPAPRALAPTR